jgi:hypothetical protein
VGEAQPFIERERERRGRAGEEETAAINGFNVDITTNNGERNGRGRTDALKLHYTPGRRTDDARLGCSVSVCLECRARGASSGGRLLRGRPSRSRLGAMGARQRAAGLGAGTASRGHAAGATGKSVGSARGRGLGAGGCAASSSSRRRLSTRPREQGEESRGRRE